MAYPPLTCGFTDSALAQLQRTFADLPEPESPRREPNGRQARGRQAAVLAIFDAEKVKRHLRATGLTVDELAKRARMPRWQRRKLEQTLAWGELKLPEAEKLARALGVSLDAITMGTRTP